jgi:hypothetical protein
LQEDGRAVLVRVLVRSVAHSLLYK